MIKLADSWKDLLVSHVGLFWAPLLLYFASLEGKCHCWIHLMMGCSHTSCRISEQKSYDEAAARSTIILLEGCGSFKASVEIFQKSREQNHGQYDSEMKPVFPLDEKKLRCLQLQLIPTDSGTAVSLQCCAQTLPFWSFCRLQPHYAVDKAS
ncbi:hypothetical protein TIFTF001_032019 [Ficus carica]|uniref:Uncharacterized protein n=1 Tax=Ficus carica TaxID=3494 RepID=A0AA88DW65_FICCA|nr:hypothetical protein TIFTF001_031976 [Ficus carica]GMN62949.1 hypothetical protein TIFTF001_032019 [Ficus carica]